MLRARNLGAQTSNPPVIVPVRLVDRMPTLKLPARQVHSTRPRHDDLPAVPIHRDGLVSYRPEAQRRDQASL